MIKKPTMVFVHAHWEGIFKIFFFSTLVDTRVVFTFPALSPCFSFFLSVCGIFIMDMYDSPTHGTPPL